MLVCVVVVEPFGEPTTAVTGVDVPEPVPAAPEGLPMLTALFRLEPRRPLKRELMTSTKNPRLASTGEDVRWGGRIKKAEAKVKLRVVEQDSDLLGLKQRSRCSNCLGQRGCVSRNNSKTVSVDLGGGRRKWEKWA